MAVYSELPKTNLKAEDIRDTLNSYGGSVSSDLTTFFKPSAKINEWSRAKPVHIYQTIEPDRSTAWYKGTDGKCGFDVTNATAVNYITITQKMTSDGKNGWNYILPSGGADSPLRLGDFAGYKADAVPPISSFTGPSTVQKGDDIIFAAYENIANTSASIPGSLHFSEIGGFNVNGNVLGLADLYFGVVIKQGDTVKAYKTSDAKGWLQCTINGGLNSGSYTAYPFMCTAYQDGVTAQSANYFTLPNTYPFNFSVIESSFPISITAKYVIANGVRNSVNVVVKVTNNSTSSRTFSSNTLQLRFSNSNMNSSLLTGESSVSLSDFTVAAGATVTITGRTGTLFSINSSYNTRDYKVVCIIGGGAYTQEAPVYEDIASS